MKQIDNLSVDVILPNYNKEKFVKEAIDSVLSQTSKNGEDLPDKLDADKLDADKLDDVTIMVRELSAKLQECISRNSGTSTKLEDLSKEVKTLSSQLQTLPVRTKFITLALPG